MADTYAVCYKAIVSNPNPIWKSDNVVIGYLPIVVYLMILIVFGTRLIYYVLRPLNQPRLVSDLIAGILLSSGILIDKSFFAEHIFPAKLVVVVTTISHVGLLYYVFLSGLEMNLIPVFRAHKRATITAISGTVIPMGLGIAIYILSQKLNKGQPAELKKHEKFESYFMWSLVLSVTGFPVVTHILADLKILYTGLGKLALSAGTVNDFYNWVIFAIFVPFAVNGKKAVYSVLSTIAFILFCYFVVRPYLVKVIEKDNKKNEWDSYHLSFVIVGFFACAAVTDVLGTNSIVGALVFGLIIPRGRFTEILIEKSDDFASGYLAPLFFASCGLRFNIVVVLKREGFFGVFLIVVLSSATKIVSTVIATGFLGGVSFQDSLALGVLMNTKGILSLIMLNIAWDKQILSADSFAILVLSILIMTSVVSPIINAIYRPRKLFEKNKLRTIQMLKAEAEIKVLTCCHNTRHAIGMIKILEALSSTNVSPMRVSACQLIELKGRATAMLAQHIDQQHHHNPSSSSSQSGGPYGLTQTQENLETITKYFESYAQDHDYNHVDTHAVVSTYDTIHRDIYNFAEEKNSSLVLLPFHKQATAEGTLEMANSAFRDINRNAMKDAPCSVGIYVDRGLVSLTKSNLNVVMLFIGGPDDREALAIAWRMSRHPRIKLTMVRILLTGKAAENDDSAHREAHHELWSTVLDVGKQKELDEDYVSSFRLVAVNNEDSITYLEKEVQRGDDVPRVLNEVGQRGCDLYVLGQGRGRSSIVLSDLWAWSDCPELGVVGDIVASSSSGSSSSVLVVQQYGFGGLDFGATNTTDQGSGRPDSSSQSQPTAVFSRLL